MINDQTSSRLCLSPTRPHKALALSVLAAGSLLLAACGGSGGTGTAGDAKQPAAGASANAAGGPTVLPVTSNPITNTATAKSLMIAHVLVEDNVDHATGKDASDHLEIELANSGSTALGGVEIFYTFRDPKTGRAESYYAELPPDFAIPAGGKRTAHFDGASAPDHFPVNKFSLYYTDKNELNVTVVASAKEAAIQTATLKKDAGGAETAD